MTLYQESGGTDHGIVGFEEGRSRQFLLFPKPLKAFLDQRIVGIKYELLLDEPVTKKEPAATEVADEAPEPKAEAKSKPVTDQKSKKKAPEPPAVLPKPGPAGLIEATPAKAAVEVPAVATAVHEDKVVKFQEPEPAPQPVVEDEIKALKRQVREAMDALEQGKQIVAFNLLKQIVETDRSTL